MQMPGRSFSAGNAYRYGFNGQEKSDEIGEGLTSAQFWEYDSRTGRRWNVDPVYKNSPYECFGGNPIFSSDVLGLDNDPPGAKAFKRPGYFTRAWRILTHQQHRTRSENYSVQLQQVASNINVIEPDENTTVIVAKFSYTNVTLDENGNPVYTLTNSYKFSVFRESKSGWTPQAYTDPLGGYNDDINMPKEEFARKYSTSGQVIDVSLPATEAASGLVMLGGKASRLFMVQQAAKAFAGNWKKFIRMGVGGATDVLNKGFHMHFEGGLEMGLKTMQDGGLGLEYIATAKQFTNIQIKNAVDVFESVLKNPDFRNELLVRLIGTQKHLQEAYKLTKDAQQAINKAHELNYIIKSLMEMK